jgi:hypothetical protein
MNATQDAKKPLHVWTADSEEWVVAESAEDACAVYCEQIGSPRSQDPDDLDFGTHPDHWTQLSDDSKLKWLDECERPHKEGVACTQEGCVDGFIRSEHTCAEHVLENGRGYLGSANY